MKTEDFNNCKAILLDFGGTLDSDGEHWLDRFYALYEAVGVMVPREDIKRVFYMADEACCKDPDVNHLGLRPLMDHHVRLQFSALGLDHPSQRETMVDAFCTKTERILGRNAHLLSRLRPQYGMGVVSNFYGNVAVLCEEAGLAPSLSVILDSTRIGISKPDPRIFELALKELQVNPSGTVFVGDSYERDMMPAQRLGMKTLWIKGPNPRLPENPQPVDGIVSSLAELESLIV